MSNYINALRSGWKAGLKQYRKRLTELRNQAQADEYQRDAIATARSEADHEANLKAYKK